LAGGTGWAPQGAWPAPAVGRHRARHSHEPRGSGEGWMTLGQPPPSRRSQQPSKGNCFIWVVEQEAMVLPSWRRVPGLHHHQPWNSPWQGQGMQVTLVHLWAELLTVQAAPCDHEAPSHPQLPPWGGAGPKGTGDAVESELSVGKELDLRYRISSGRSCREPGPCCGHAIWEHS